MSFTIWGQKIPTVTELSVLWVDQDLSYFVFVNDYELFVFIRFLSVVCEAGVHNLYLIVKFDCNCLGFLVRESFIFLFYVFVLATCYWIYKP